MTTVILHQVQGSDGMNTFNRLSNTRYDIYQHHLHTRRSPLIPVLQRGHLFRLVLFDRTREDKRITFADSVML